MTSQAALGVVLGLVTAFFIGLFMVPRRYARSDTLSFIVGMTAGACLGSTVYWLVSGAPFSWSWMALFALVPGANWAVGSYAYAWGTQSVGLAKATGIKNTQVVVTTAGGFLLFNDAADTEPVLAILGAALVVATALVLSRTRHREESVPNATLRGYLVPIIASFLYGVNGLLMAWIIDSGISKPEMNAGIGLGSFLAAAALFAVIRGKANVFSGASLRDHAWALSGGVIWAVGLVTMILSIAYAGLAVAWSLMNLSVVVGVLYGVFFFREIDLRERAWPVAWGLVLACLGIGALYLSKAVPPDLVLRYLHSAR